MALVGDHIGGVDARVGFLAGEFQQRLVPGEMAALREIEAAIGAPFRRSRRWSRRSAARRRRNFRAAHGSVWRFAARLNSVTTVAKLGAPSWDSNKVASAPSSSTTRMRRWRPSAEAASDAAPVEAQVQRGRQRHALGNMKDEAFFHQGGVEIDDRVVGLRIDPADDPGDGRILLRQNLAQALPAHGAIGGSGIVQHAVLEGGDAGAGERRAARREPDSTFTVSCSALARSE